MNFKRYDNEEVINLLPCPFCGSDPKIKHIGNYHTKKIKVQVKCSNTSCRIERTDAALTHDFTWLEDIAVKHWNNRTPNKADSVCALSISPCKLSFDNPCNSSCPGYKQQD